MWIVKMNMPLILMSLVGAGMIVIVILLKKGFGRFLPQRLFPLLWICVLIRLLIPFSISSPLNLTSFSKWGNWAEFRTFGIAESTNVVVMDEAPAVQKGTQTQTSVTNEISEQIAMQAPAFQLNWNIETIYTTGVLATGIFLIWRFIQTRRKFDASVLIEEDPRIISVLDAQKVTAEVYLNDRIQGPLVFGLRRPLIFLPSTLDFTDSELLRNILQHECTHIRRHDNWMKLAAVAALSIHWFNPLVWLMVNAISRDLEEACDESVLTQMNLEQRQSYARALIQMSRKQLKFAWNYCAFSRNEVERRVRKIAAYKPLRKIVMVACVGFIALFSMFTAAAAQAPFIAELSSSCSSSDSRFILEAELKRDLNLSLSSQTRSRADQALIQVLKDNPDSGLAALKQKAAAVLAEEFHAEVQAFHIDAYLNLDEAELQKEYQAHAILYQNQRYTYEGKPVRNFEDSMAGRYFMNDEGDVDVYVVRDDLGRITELKTYVVK